MTFAEEEILSKESVIPLKNYIRVTGASNLKKYIYNEEFDPGSG